MGQAAPHGARMWIAGARPRTLGASISPVVVGTAAAGHATVLVTLACLVVALGLQIGVNYANDYFDGTRGVDTPVRAGPVRITASNLATPRAVLTAALLSFAVAGATGLALSLAIDARLLIVGILAIVAALAYSGGPRPYANLGVGEASVFIFFGLAAVCGTAFAQSWGIISGSALICSLAVGGLAVAILVTNNLRDIPSDDAAGKRTLAVRIGDPATRALYRALVLASLGIPIVAAAAGALPRGTLLVIAAIPLAFAPLRLAGTARGRDLVPVLQKTALVQVVFGALLAIGLWIR